MSESDEAAFRAGVEWAMQTAQDQARALTLLPRDPFWSGGRTALAALAKSLSASAEHESRRYSALLNARDAGAALQRLEGASRPSSRAPTDPTND